MKNSRLILFLALIVASGIVMAQPCADPVNIYNFMYGGKSYEIVREKKTWENASACAVERGGYLVEIGSLAEQAAVFDAIINGAGVSPTYTTSPDGGGIAYVWIGATDKLTEGTWLWDGDNDGSGQNFWTGQGTAGAGGGSAVGGSYINWGGTSTGTPNEPDNWNNQDAAGIGLAGWPSGTTLLGVAGEWNDISLSNQMYFVIEYDNTGFNGFEKDELKLFRFPGKGTVRLSSLSVVIDKVKVYSLLGMAVMNTNVGQKEITLNLGNLDQGIYILSVFLENGKTFNRRITLPF